MTQRQKIIFISIFIITGYVVSLAYHFYVANYLKLNYYPYNTFLFRPEDRFGDFLDIFNAGKNPYGVEKFSWALFPLFTFLAHVMYLTDNKIVLLALYIVLFVCILSMLIWRLTADLPSRLKSLLLFSFIFCSYPILISIDRTNIENAIFLIIFISTILIQKKKYLAAGCVMGIAIALKPYSVFFLPLFLIEGQVLPAILAGGFAALLSFVSLFLLPGSFMNEIGTLRTNMSLYNGVYVLNNEGLYFGTSLFGALKVISYWIGNSFRYFQSNADVLAFNRALLQPYFLITNVTFLAIIAILLFYKTSLWKKTAILAASLALLPYVGSAYRLLYFFIPIVLFIIEDESDQKDGFYAALFGLILIPTSYIHFSFAPIFLINSGEVSDTVLLHPIVITILLVSLIIDVFRQKMPNESFLSLVRKIYHFAANGVNRHSAKTLKP